jgi:hypothetical protein
MAARISGAMLCFVLDEYTMMNNIQVLLMQFCVNSKLKDDKHVKYDSVFRSTEFIHTVYESLFMEIYVAKY